jgi:hypothetical protein
MVALPVPAAVRSPSEPVQAFRTRMDARIEEIIRHVLPA